MVEHIIALKEFGRVGPKTFRRLIERFGSPENVLSAEVGELSEVPRVSEGKAREILKAGERIEDARQLVAEGQARGIRAVTLFDETYPPGLQGLDDPPPVLYIRGCLLPEDARAAAVVGTHRASDRGREMATKIGRRLAGRGITVISGLALGIDAAAHRGALDRGGRTIAALGSGLERVHPRENVPLAGEIPTNGALLSEYAPDVPVSVGGLMARNRIVTGLSRAVIIVEALINSVGTMDAATRGGKQNRPVYVIRWNDAPGGADMLIAGGAIPLTNTADVDDAIEQIGRGP